MNQACLETSQTPHEESKTKLEIGTDILRKKAGSSFLNMLHVTTDTLCLALGVSASIRSMEHFLGGRLNQ